MPDEYVAEFRFYIEKGYKIEAFYPIKNNGCCDKDFFILTKSDQSYSCQCGCGMWCTSGHSTAQEAVDEYRFMCKRYEEAKKRRIKQ